MSTYIIASLIGFGLTAASGVAWAITESNLSDDFDTFEALRDRGDVAGANAFLTDTLKPNQTLRKIFSISTGVLGVTSAALLITGFVVSPESSHVAVQAGPNRISVGYSF